jgi:hypothetical protein
LLAVLVILLNFTAVAPASADAALGEGSPGEFGVEPLVEGSAIHRGVPPPDWSKGVRRPRRCPERAWSSTASPGAVPPEFIVFCVPGQEGGQPVGETLIPRCAPPSGVFEFKGGVPGH